MNRGCLWSLGTFVGLLILGGILGSMSSHNGSSSARPASTVASPSRHPSRPAAAAPTEAPPVDHCSAATGWERKGMAAVDNGQWSTAYRYAESGLHESEDCSNDDAQVINKGYLLSVKAFAEHHLSYGDSTTDINQATTLLAECQSLPGIYGTHIGAACETQEENDIKAKTQWDMDNE